MIRTFIVAEVLLTNKFVNKDTQEISYRTTINSTRLVKGDDGVEVEKPETIVMWLEERLPQGKHLLMVEPSFSKKYGMGFRFIKKIDSPEILQSLVELGDEEA